MTDTLTTNLNSINNNKLINNGSHNEEDNSNDVSMDADVDFMMDQIRRPQEAEQLQQVPEIDNDDNNNSANDLGPETDVDAIIYDDFNQNVAAGGGEKEKNQMEFKETADVVDNENSLMGALENKIFGEIFPEMKGGNPFAAENFAAPIDNKMMEVQSELQQQFDFGANELSEKMENISREVDFVMHETAASAIEMSSSANNEEVAIKQEEEPHSGESFELFLFQ